jgi:hypothetical protein
MITLTASLGTCAWSAMTSADVVRPSTMPTLRGALERAAQAAQGQRVLVVTNKPGAAPSGVVFESSRTPTGWAAFPPTPTPGDPLLPAIEKLAQAAASDFAAGGKLEAPTVRALAVFDVAVVVVGDGEPTIPDVGERDPALGVAPEVPALRLRKAQPVMLFLAEQAAIDPSDAVGFARTLRGGDAIFQDFEDHAPWGMDVTIDTDADTEYLLPTTAAGARVTIDGVSATFRAARVPMMIVKVPEGLHHVSVRYGDDAVGRQWIPIVAAACAVLAFVVLWLGLRPHPSMDPDA